MTFYNDLAQSADSLLKEFGAIGVLRYAPTGTYDPLTGQVSAAALVSVDVNAAVFDYDDKDINGSLIQSGDKQVFVSAVGVKIDPQVSGEFEWPKGGITYKVVKVKPLSPGAVDVLYELQVRR